MAHKNTTKAAKTKTTKTKTTKINAVKKTVGTAKKTAKKISEKAVKTPRSETRVNGSVVSVAETDTVKTTLKSGGRRTRKSTISGSDPRNSKVKPGRRYNLFETKFPDGTVVQKRFPKGKEVDFAIHAKILLDDSWHVILWSHGNNSEQRRNAYHRAYVDEGHSLFRQKIYSDVKIGKVSLVGEIGEKDPYKKENREVLKKVKEEINLHVASKDLDTPSGIENDSDKEGGNPIEKEIKKQKNKNKRKSKKPTI